MRAILRSADRFANRKNGNFSTRKQHPRPWAPNHRYGRSMFEVVLPVLDEAAAIPVVIDSLPAGFVPIVVDNGSTDRSAEIARACGARVVYESQRGFGAACAAGLRAASTDIVCFMDCDGSLHGSDLPRLVEPLLAGTAALVLGARHPVARDAWPRHARAANRLLALEIRRRTGVVLRDLGPMRAAFREPLRHLGIRDRRFGWPLEMVLRAAAAGWRIEEIRVGYEPRVGRSKVTGTVRGTVRATLDMARALR
jgi:glycosyltransferase involved in cell wall biosynthesis